MIGTVICDELFSGEAQFFDGPRLQGLDTETLLCPGHLVPVDGVGKLGKLPGQGIVTSADLGEFFLQLLPLLLGKVTIMARQIHRNIDEPEGLLHR